MREGLLERELRERDGEFEDWGLSAALGLGALDERCPSGACGGRLGTRWFGADFDEVPLVDLLSGASALWGDALGVGILFTIRHSPTPHRPFPIATPFQKTDPPTRVGEAEQRKRRCTEDKEQSNWDLSDRSQNFPKTHSSKSQRL